MLLFDLEGKFSLEIARFHTVQQLTGYDQKQFLKGRNSIYSLGHYLEALETAVGYVKAWKRESDPAAFRLALGKAFNELPPIERMKRELTKQFNLPKEA